MSHHARIVRSLVYPSLCFRICLLLPGRISPLDRAPVDRRVIDVCAPVFFTGRCVSVFQPSVVGLSALFGHHVDHTGLRVAIFGWRHPRDNRYFLDGTLVDAGKHPGTLTVLVQNAYPIYHKGHVGGPVVGSLIAQSCVPAPYPVGPVLRHPWLEGNQLVGRAHDGQPLNLDR